MLAFRSCFRLVLIALLPLGCCACVVIPWPPLPAVTYHGRVLDAAGRPAAHAELTFYRPGSLVYKQLPALEAAYDPEEEIAHAFSRRDGTFQAITRGGYATAVHVSGPHQSAHLGESLRSPVAPLPRDLTVRLERY